MDSPARANAYAHAGVESEVRQLKVRDATPPRRDATRRDADATRRDDRRRDV